MGTAAEDPHSTQGIAGALSTHPSIPGLRLQPGTASQALGFPDRSLGTQPWVLSGDRCLAAQGLRPCLQVKSQQGQRDPRSCVRGARVQIL